MRYRQNLKKWFTPLDSEGSGFQTKDTVTIFQKRNKSTNVRVINLTGFTLVELLIVVALIGILSTLFVFALMNARQKTRDAERVSATNQIRAALELGFVQLAGYPAQSEGDLQLGGASAHALCEVSSELKFVDSAPECSGTVFMENVPASPLPKDGSCDNVQNNYVYKAGSGGTDFKLEFCLGKAPSQSGLTNGLNCVTSNGIEAGGCK